MNTMIGVRQASEILGVTREYVIKQFNNGLISGERDGTVILLHRSSVLAFKVPDTRGKAGRPPRSKTGTGKKWKKKKE